MTCMTAFAPATAVPTTELTRVTPNENPAFWQLEGYAEHKSPRMSWVVVTGKDGLRRLRILWELENTIRERDLMLTIVNHPCYSRDNQSAWVCGRVSTGEQIPADCTCNLLFIDGAHTAGLWMWA